MKLLFENWRRYLNESYQDRAAEAFRETIEAEDKLLFYEWLVNDLKDEAFIKWIEIHQARAQWVAPRNASWDPYDTTIHMMPMTIKSPSDACNDYLYLNGTTYGASKFEQDRRKETGEAWSEEINHEFWEEGEKLTKQFQADRKEITEHLNQIKVKFPYDLFAEFDCKEKMSLLDELVRQVRNCPYQTYSGPVAEAKSAKYTQSKLTPYEKCVIEFQHKASAEAEMERLPRFEARTPDSQDGET